MKRIFSTALAIVLFIGAAQAQNKGDKGRHHGDEHEMAMNQLDLTADQKARINTIREAQKAEMQALKKNDKITVADMKAKRQELQEKYKAQYKAVLTTAQLEELKSHKAEGGKMGKKEKGFGKRGGDMGEQAAFFKKELNLSADQETRIKSIFQEFKTKADAIRSNSSLSGEQKREQTQTLARQYIDMGKAVLNAEQLKKFEEMKGKHGGKRKRDF